MIECYLFWCLAFFSRLSFHAVQNGSPFHILVVTKPQVTVQNGTAPFLHLWQRDAVDRRAWPISEAVPPLALTFCVHHEYVVWRSVLATFAVSVEDELSRLLPPALPSSLIPSRCVSPSFVACCSRRPLPRPLTTGRRSCAIFPFHYSIRQIPPQDCWQDGDLERTPPTAHGGTLSERISRRRSCEETSRPFDQEQHQRA